MTIKKLKPSTTLRAVSEDGLLSIRIVKLDEDGEVICVASEPVTLESKTLSELLMALEVSMQNITKPIIVLNACTKGEYKWR